MADVRDRTRKDLDRLRRREPAGGFWRSFALLGSVGWPVVLLTTGGALLGRTCDRHLHTGIRLTLILLIVGAVLGCFISYRSIRENRR